MNVGRRSILIGAVLIAIAAILAVPGVAIAYQAVNAVIPPGQDVLIVIEAIVRLTSISLPPVGAALLGAGIVIQHLDRQRQHQDRLNSVER